MSKEPIWAIGTGEAASPEYTLQVIARLREKLVEKFGVGPAELVRFIYGGSVTVSNAAEFLRYPEISGVLAGGVSVKASDFLKVCQIAAKTS